MAASEIKGGWQYTAFSNAEDFSNAVVNGFAATMDDAKMEQVGLYPGNAKESMIRWYADSEFIEAGNISLLHCHGNPWVGPSLEYMPTPMLNWPGTFEWGDRGKLMWVGLGGCDILGFSTYPDGRVAAECNPRPDRWDSMFKGISGVLGYRSSSWYSKDNPTLGALTGSTFANSLLSGMTFFEAWFTAGDFLHRNIGRQAEIAVFVSSKDALEDTLEKYSLERNVGIYPPGIRRRLVGRGPAPQFDYCEQVNEDGSSACLQSSGLTQLTSNLWINSDLDLTAISMPTFSWIPDNMDWASCAPPVRSAKQLRQFQVRGVGRWIFETAHSAAELFEEALHAEQSSRSELVLIPDAHSEMGQRATGYRAVLVDGVPIPIYADYGAVIEELSVGLVAGWSDIQGIAKSDGIVTVQRDSGLLCSRFAPTVKAGAWVTVEDTRPVYVPEQVGPSYKLMPRIAVYLRSATASGIERFVQLI